MRTSGGNVIAAAGEVVIFAALCQQFDLRLSASIAAVGAVHSTVFFINADAADNYGVELELRRDWIPGDLV